MHQDMLYLIRLLDLDANSNTVYAGFYEYFLILVSGYRKWVQQDLGRASGFNLRDIVSFRGLRCEI